MSGRINLARLIAPQVFLSVLAAPSTVIMSHFMQIRPAVALLSRASRMCDQLHCVDAPDSTVCRYMQVIVQ